MATGTGRGTVRDTINRRALTIAGGVAAAASALAAGRRARANRRRRAALAAHASTPPVETIPDAELRSTVARLDTLLARSPASFAFFTVDGLVLRVNESFAALFGHTAATLTGEQLADALPKIWPRVQPLVERVSNTGAPIVDLEVTGRSATLPGVDHHWLLSLFPVEAGRREVGALVVDITERKRSEQEIELLASASNLFAVDLTIDDALDAVSRLAIPTFADACLVFLPSADGRGDLVRVAHRDAETEKRLRALAPELPPQRAGLATERAMRSGEIELMETVTEDQRRELGVNDVAREFFDALGAVSALTVPLALGGRSIGAVVLVYNDSSDRRYRAADVDITRELGRRIAQVIDNVRLAGHAARAAGRLALLARIGELLTVELDLGQRLRSVARLALPELADACGAYVVDNGRLQLVGAGHPDPELQDALDRAELPSHPLDAAIPPCEAVREGRAVLLEDVPPAVASQLIAGLDVVEGIDRGSTIHSYLAVPLTGDDGPIGALGFAFSFSPRRYSPDDIPIALEIARRVTPAVENARRYEDDREVIEVLQRSLLPSALPSVPGLSITGRYIPGAAGLRIGGDWYDALVLDDGRVFFAIGDVVGHGVRAAATMGRMRNALEVFATDERSPARILTRLNRHFTSVGDADMATVGLLVYDPNTGVARLASAGHLAPLVLNEQGEVTYLEIERGMPVCASPRATYHDTDVAIPPGSTLLLCTDGLVERRGEALDAGLMRLAEAVRDGPDGVDALADHVIGTLLGDTGSTDDVALLVVQVEPVAASLSLRVGTNPRELVRVRRAVAEWARTADATADECNDLVLAVNEAVANAMLHAYGLAEADVEIDAQVRSAGTVEVRVRDSGRWRPDRPRAGGGRGLALIRNLMDDVKVETSPSGTTVCMCRSLVHAAGARA